MIDQGEFCALDSRKAAEGFFQLIAGYAHEKVLLCIENEIAPDEIASYVALAADLFLRGIERSEPA